MMARAFTFALQREDPLGVLGSCSPEVEGAAHVRIDADAVARFAGGGRARGSAGVRSGG